MVRSILSAGVSAGACLLALSLGSCARKATDPVVAAAPAAPAAPVAAAAPAASDPAQLSGAWTLQTLQGQPVPPSATPEQAAQLVFDTAESRVWGSTGCNRIMGSYLATATTIRFGQMATTRRACLGPNVEQTLLTALAAPSLTYQLSGAQLILLQDSTPVAVLTRAAPVPPDK